MAYHDIALLSADTAFLNRAAACYAVETLNNPEADNPNQWATKNAWAMAAQPDFGAAYTYAINGGNTSPGSDPAVITDAMILAGVQSVMATG